METGTGESTADRATAANCDTLDRDDFFFALQLANGCADKVAQSERGRVLSLPVAIAFIIAFRGTFTKKSGHTFTIWIHCIVSTNAYSLYMRKHFCLFVTALSCGHACSHILYYTYYTYLENVT